jgi:hypothetical protein
MAGEIIPLIRIFIDHSNTWGGARLASRVRHPKKPDEAARISVRRRVRPSRMGGTVHGLRVS